MRLNLAAACLVFFLQTMLSAVSLPEVRTWTSADGRTLQATFTKMEGDQVLLQLGNGQTALVPLNRLSAADQAFIKTQPGSSATTPGKTWPDVVEVSTRSLEVSAITEDAAAKNYVYRSESFQFVSQDKLAGSVMKEIARTFEATHSLVQALPWNIEPKPPVDLGYYQAKFYVNRRSYILDGGPENSGGVYFSRDRIFRVPFESLGVVMRGKTWFKDDDYRNDTLVHEITHQMMHDYLPFLPTWVIEGTAEYAEMIPYNAGKFLASSHERGFKEYLKHFAERSITPSNIGSLTDHMNMTGDQWHAQANKGSGEQSRLYFTSCFLIYYFNHLDGEGQGDRFIKYLGKMAEARDAWKAFFENPEVKRNANGGFTYPSSLKLPAQKRDDVYGLEQLTVLRDGRTPYQLEEDIKTGFKKIGVKW